MPNHPAKRQARAFTLIELLVVISIIALLIGILLPVLGAARESARQSQCRSNLHQQAIASEAFSTDNNDLPAGHNLTGSIAHSVYGGGTYNWTAANSFGGKSGKIAELGANVVENVSASERPLTEYVLQANPTLDTGGDDRMEIPLFQCPSEIAGAGGQFDAFFSAPNPDDTAYNVMGTSYGDVTGIALHDPRLGVRSPNSIAQITDTRKRLYRHLSGSGSASDIVLYAEIMFTYAMTHRTAHGGGPALGFHGEEGLHNVAFWDGSVSTVTQDRDSLRTQGTFVPGVGVVNPVQGNEEWSLYANPRPYPLD
ncbi:DUF1559 domain-containing protein [Phycisphaeraceae bacterium D3-23]